MATQIRGNQIFTATVPSSALILSDITSLSNLATVGTISSGVWNGTAVAVNHGGTGSTNASDARTSLGLAIGSDVQAYSSILADLAAGNPVSVSHGGTNASTASQARINLGLEIGTDVQAYNSTLASVAAGTYAGDDSIVTVGTVSAGTWQGNHVAVQYGGTGADTASGARTNLGVAIGSDVQAYSSILAGIAADTDVRTILQGGTGSSTAIGARNNLGLVIGTDVQAYNSTLAAVAGGTYTGDDSIATVGTITAGVWNGSAIGASYLPALNAITAPTGNVSMNSYRLTNLAAPVGANDAARLVDVQAASTGTYLKGAVKVIVQSNVNIASPGATLDGVSMSNGFRVALVGQTNAADNGIYDYNGASSAMTRSADADTSAEVKSGMAFYALAGTSAGQGFFLSTPDPIVLDTTALTFLQFTGLPQIIVGDGLVRNGNQLDLVLNGGTLSKSASGIKVASGGITATELASGSVSGSKLQSNSVGVGALNSNVFGYGLVGGSGSTVHIQQSMEEVTGTKNGSNTAFTLAHTPGSGTVQIFRNGVRQVVNTDFTVSGSNITMSVAPVSDETLQAVYFW